MPPPERAVLATLEVLGVEPHQLDWDTIRVTLPAAAEPQPQVYWRKTGQLRAFFLECLQERDAEATLLYYRGTEAHVIACRTWGAHRVWPADAPLPERPAPPAKTIQEASAQDRAAKNKEREEEGLSRHLDALHFY